MDLRAFPEPAADAAWVFFRRCFVRDEMAAYVMGLIRGVCITKGLVYEDECSAIETIMTLASPPESTNVQDRLVHRTRMLIDYLCKGPCRMQDGPWAAVLVSFALYGKPTT